MEAGSSSNDSFRMLRLRFLRPPPSSLLLPSSKTSSIALEIAVGVTDDYGAEGDAFFSSLDLSLSLVDSSGFKPYQNATLSFADNSSPSNFTIYSSRGHFHTLKPIITFQSTSIKPTSMRFLLSVASTGEIPPILSECSQKMREVIGEENQEPIESWDGSRFILMRVFSGEVKVVMSGKKGEGSASTSKVQTAIRTLHIQPANSNSPSVPLYAVERPGLNNSTGSRLWDCSVGLSCFLSVNSSYILPNAVTSSSTSNVLPSRIIEVGSGCGLASLAALKIIQSTNLTSSNLAKSKVDIVQTDIEATVNTTLAENLETNLPSSSRYQLDNCTIKSTTLDWGILSNEDKLHYLGVNKKEEAQHLTILGSDILYDPDTHLALLQTINSLLGPTLDGLNALDAVAVKRKALIAYKARTEGDDGFFELARRSGRQVKKVWAWGEIQVWIIH